MATTPGQPSTGRRADAPDRAARDHGDDRPDTPTTALERRRLADQLHRGVLQQVTALSLAVDSALLHHADGDPVAVEGALRSVRALADQAVLGCRTLMDELRRSEDP